MNVTTKLLKKFLASFDDAVEKMPRQTTIMIRQLFFTVIFVASLIALFTGISMGRKAADKGGVRLVETTNDSFEIQVSRERQSIGFSEMMDDSNISEYDKSQPEKETYEAGSSHQMQNEFPILENGGPEKNQVSAPEPIISTRPLENDRGDIADDEFASPARPIEPSSAGTPRTDNLPLETEPLNETTNTDNSSVLNAGTSRNEEDSTGDIRQPGPNPEPATREEAPRPRGTDIREPSALSTDGDILE